MIPVHIDPSRELDESNLMTLCEPHHYTFGHYCKWASRNENVRRDADTWRRKILERP